MANLPHDRKKWRGLQKKRTGWDEGYVCKYNVYDVIDLSGDVVTIYVPLRGWHRERWNVALLEHEHMERERERAYLEQRYGTHRVESIRDYWQRAN